MHDQLYVGVTGHAGPIDAAMRAAGFDIYGVSAGPYGVIVHFAEMPSPEQAQTALALIDAHDPVFLSVDKTQITADGVDFATVKVRAPKPGAAPVTLVITPSGGDPVTQAVDLIDGVGTVEIDSIDPQVITVTVQDGDNRTTDSIEIGAV